VKTDRRRFLAAAAALGLAGCEALSTQDWVLKLLGIGEYLNYKLHRLLIPNDKLAPEFTEADISPWFKPNGADDIPDADYQALVKRGFEGWKLEIGGLVDKPLQLSLAELRALPSRTQITRHDCVEGWSCIGKWQGVPLGALLKQAGLSPKANFIVFHCADLHGNDETPYYESIDLVDAFHPQTILAYQMNGKPLPVAHGAPLRLRVERQLGYKMAKYVMRVVAVESFADLGDGKGGYWEDRGYDWYAGI
jgi:DMSO/TMAO reductase YedYZ molybdopterin-dependent catalytic subunit